MLSAKHLSKRSHALIDKITHEHDLRVAFNLNKPVRAPNGLLVELLSWESVITGVEEHWTARDLETGKLRFYPGHELDQLSALELLATLAPPLLPVPFTRLQFDGGLLRRILGEPADGLDDGTQPST